MSMGHIEVYLFEIKDSIKNYNIPYRFPEKKRELFSIFIEFLE